jgi:predicted enzyme related to lactoylglutathione lyase
MTSGMIVYVFSPQFDELRRFYEEAIGIAGEPAGPNWVVPLSGSKFALHRQIPEDPQDPNPLRLDFLVGDLDQAIDRCKAAGAKLVRGVQDEAFGRSAILQDPEGREFTLVHEELPPVTRKPHRRRDERPRGR